MTKLCKKCNIIKPLEEFTKRKDGADGYRYECLLCNKQKVVNFQKSKLGLSGCIYHDQVRHSKTRKHDKPQYSLKEFREWLFNQENFDDLYSNWIKSDFEKDKRPSVDRLNNLEGYSFNNIQLITWKENNEKEYNRRRNNEHPRT